MHEMRYCASCKKSTVHLGKRTSHIFHLLMSVLTAGLWIPIWVLVTVSNSMRHACTICGTKTDWRF